MMDGKALDRALADAAKLFGVQAASCNERAEACEEGALCRSDPVYRRSQARRAAQLRQHARRWLKRRDVALRGLLLVGPEERHEPEFMRSFTDLIIAAEAADRTVTR